MLCGIYPLTIEIEKQLLQLVELRHWYGIIFVIIPLVVNITCIKPLLISLEGFHNIYFVKANTFISFNSDIFPTYLLSWQLTA